VAYQLPVLGYEPYIDAETMRLHHDKHHQPYIDQPNKAVATDSQFDRTTVEDLLAHLNDVPEEISAVVRNSGGGHVWHYVLLSSPFFEDKRSN
jgi:Fe-Mn family superoxide dismutase